MVSTYEEETKKFLTKQKDIQEGKVMVYYQLYDQALFLLAKLLVRCEEVEKSRDNWKEKYIKLKEQYNDNGQNKS